MVATSCAGSNGLTIQPVAPASLPSRLRSAEPSVVSIRIGVWRYAASARSARISSMPSMTGMFTSEQHQVERRLAREVAALLRRPRPCVTSKPAPVSAMRTMSRIEGESSTARMRVMRQLLLHRQRQQRLHAEQARGFADDRRIAEPLRRLRCVRDAVAHEGAQQLHGGSVDALDAADVERHRSHSRGADTARASARLHLSRCNWWQARSSAARAPRFGGLDNRSDGRRCALALRLLGTHRALLDGFHRFLCGIGTCRSGFRDWRLFHSRSRSAPAAAKLLKQFTAEQ